MHLVARSLFACLLLSGTLAAQAPLPPSLVLEGEIRSSQNHTYVEVPFKVPPQWISDGSRYWLRVEIHDAQGRLLLLGNPVYINWGDSFAGQLKSPMAKGK